MTNKNDRAMEYALIESVNMELEVIRSFCKAQFPCDIPSVIAVRMSRAIISAICRINTNAIARQQDMFSEEGKLFLNETLIQLEQLSELFAQRIQHEPESDLVWNTWAE